MKSARTFDPQLLASLRDLPLGEALHRLGLHVSVDRDFQPTKDARTQRWLVSLPVGTAELLVTGSKWFDARVAKGGGGCIDLAMHLLGVDFVAAVKRLSSASN